MRFFRKRPAAMTGDRQSSANLPDKQIPHAIDLLLDQVIALFAPRTNLMAEILIEVPQTNQLITYRIRPDTSLALHMRLRIGEGLAGQVFATGKLYVGDINREDVTARGSGSKGDVAHLFTTKSSLIYPLHLQHNCVGVLNVESPKSGDFDATAITQLQASGLINRFQDTIGLINFPTMSEDAIIQRILDNFERDAVKTLNIDDMQGTYFQILQVAAQIVGETNVSGGMYLVRDLDQELIRDDATQRNSAIGNASSDYWITLVAKLGDFAYEKEWPFQARSVVQRIITTQRGEIIADRLSDPDYRVSSKNNQAGSGLLVPLLRGRTVIGVISLDSIVVGSFTNDDLKHMLQLAKLAVDVINRAEINFVGLRARRQLACTNEIQKELAALFPENMQALIPLDVEAVRAVIYAKIVAWACEYTRSEYASILLPEHSGQKVFLRRHAFRGIGREPTQFHAPITQGITWTVFQSGKTRNIPDVSQESDYFPLNSDTQSELAVSLQRGSESIGVLNIEACRLNNFDLKYIQWAEFLGVQCAFAMTVLDAAKKTQADLELGYLNRKIDQELNQMRQQPMDSVRTQRDALLLEILQTFCRLTGAAVGRILLAQNAYLPNGEIDVANGLMHFMISTIPAEVEPGSKRYFPLSEGSTIITLREKILQYFNDASNTPPGFFSHSTGRIESGFFAPIYEGAQVVGILNIESERPNTFTPEYIAGGLEVAEMASKLIVAARLQIRQQHADLLRHFELAILRNRSTYVPGFMENVLRQAADLVELPSGIGRVILVRHSEDEQYFLTDAVFSLAYPSNQSQVTEEAATRRQVTFSIFLRALKEKRPILINDIGRMLDSGERDQEMLHGMQSLLCVPLLLPKDRAASVTKVDDTDFVITSLHQDELIATGMIFITSPRLSEFSEADKIVLTNFAQTVINGLNNISLLDAGKDMMERVRHDFTSALSPFSRAAREILVPLKQAQTAQTLSEALEEVHQVNTYFQPFLDLSTLFYKLMNWFFTISTDSDSPEDAPTTSISVYDFKNEMEAPINTLADILHTITVHWVIPVATLSVPGGMVRFKMVCAVLFKFLDNAIKFTSRDDVTVTIQPDGDYVAFAVSNSGEEIDSIDQHMLFQLHFRTKTAQSVPGDGIGLFQARDIARRLGGDVTYAYREGKNIFTLLIPQM